MKRTGDGILIEFRSVVDAERCSIEMQNGMVERNAVLPPERQILFRVGIHLGDVIEEADRDLMGDGVNIAARLEGICEPGDVCLSGAAYEQVRDKIAAEFVDLGERALKNIVRPVRAYAIPAPAHSGRTMENGGEASAPVKAGPPRLPLVVLPFANMSGDEEQEYFADGLTEDLTTELSRMPSAFVIARNTAFTYKGKAADVKAIGRELGVRYALEGSVRKSGSRIRFNAQLIDAQTGAHLWADRFDRELVDLFDLQDSVVQELAGVMNLQLADAETRRGRNKLNPDAFDLLLRALSAINRGNSRENISENLRLFEAALGRDPDNIAAMCGIVVARVARVSSLWSEDRAAEIAAAEAKARRAQVLAPKSGEVRFSVGFLRRIQMRFDEAIVEFMAVLRDNPNHVGAQTELGWALAFTGRDREAIDHLTEAIRRSPRDPNLFLGYCGIGYVRYEMRDYEAALAALREAIALNPHFSWAHLIFTVSQSALGRETAAREALASYFRTNPAVKTIAGLRANPVSPRLASDDNRFHEALRKGGDARSNERDSKLTAIPLSRLPRATQTKS